MVGLNHSLKKPFMGGKYGRTFLPRKSKMVKRLSFAPITSQKLARCAEPASDTSGYFLMEERVV